MSLDILKEAFHKTLILKGFNQDGSKDIPGRGIHGQGCRDGEDAAGPCDHVTGGYGTGLGYGLVTHMFRSVSQSGYIVRS